MQWAPAETNLSLAWLELYVMFRMQGVKPFVEKRTVLDKDVKLNEEMRSFKAGVKKLRLFNVARSDEWMFEPSLARANRLRPIGVTNMHASIKCIPLVGSVFSRSVAEQIVRMQGHISSNKSQSAYANGTLSVVHKPFHLKRNVPEFSPQGDGANQAAEFDDSKPSDRSMPIDSLICPVCMHERAATNFTLHRHSSFSNMKCLRCCTVQTTRLWLCTCGITWSKCTKHVVRSLKRKAAFIDRRVALTRKYGTPKFFPAYRQGTLLASAPKRAAANGIQEVSTCKRICLPPESKLGRKFPHLVKRDSPTKGAALDVRTPHDPSSRSTAGQQGNRISMRHLGVFA